MFKKVLYGCDKCSQLFISSDAAAEHERRCQDLVLGEEVKIAHNSKLLSATITDFLRPKLPTFEEASVCVDVEDLHCNLAVDRSKVVAGR